MPFGVRSISLSPDAEKALSWKYNVVLPGSSDSLTTRWPVEGSIQSLIANP
jgi:hypothetical protein